MPNAKLTFFRPLLLRRPLPFRSHPLDFFQPSNLVRIPRLQVGIRRLHILDGQHAPRVVGRYGRAFEALAQHFVPGAGLRWVESRGEEEALFLVLKFDKSGLDMALHGGFGHTFIRSRIRALGTTMSYAGRGNTALRIIEGVRE